MQDNGSWDRWPLPAFEDLKARAKARGASLDDVLALVQANDPYAAGRPHRLRAAKWFAEVSEALDIPAGWHLRRIHYLLVSRPDAVPWPDGRSYTNTLKDWYGLCHAARDAVALSLVPANTLSDARNDRPYLADRAGSYSPGIDLDAGWFLFRPSFVLPKLRTAEVPRPTIERPYVIEIWAEKTTVNDVLFPLAQQYGLNVVTAAGEISAIACRELVERAVARGRPVRVLYVSDFDPAGRSIPVAMARKVEYEIDRRQFNLDIQVRPIVLTHEQCVAYSLPRAPIKDTERRGARFEARFGEGATELDALEALHPGELRRILQAEIKRYWNPDHDDQVAEAWAVFEIGLVKINDAVRAEFDAEVADINAEVRALGDVFAQVEQKTAALFYRMRQRLEEQQPVFKPPKIEFAADEDSNPLLDSRRDYLDQLASYKRFQGKAPEG